MSNPHDSRDPLEKFVDGVLHELPPRRAPRTLEARVLAEIARRSSKAWWQRSFGYWPISARVVFLLACVATGVAVARIWNWLFGVAATPALSSLSSELTPAATSVKVTASAFSSIAHSIPSVWVYGTLIAILVLYAALFGIGAAAYRTLYASR